MSRIIQRIRNDLRKDQVIETYVRKNRYIEPHTYQKVKNRKTCGKCQIKFISYKQSQIHHIIPHDKGGNNEEENLMLVCKPCHKILDKEQGVR